MRMFGEKLNLVKLLSCVAVVALVSMPAVAAVACDDEDAMINPALALCSTHVYNVGGDENPSDGADREMMREVVALKTTIMTQQMNKQYEYLESMIGRFKVQLEKAVLMAKLEKAGANTNSGSSSSGGGASFKSNDRSIFVSGVENCNNKLLPADVLNCLNTNLTTISNLSGGGTDVSSDVRKQFINDYKLLTRTYDVEDAKCATTEIDCTKDSDLRKKQNFQDCMDTARSCIRNKMYKLNLEAQKYKD